MRAKKKQFLAFILAHKIKNIYIERSSEKRDVITFSVSENWCAFMFLHPQHHSHILFSLYLICIHFFTKFSLAFAYTQKKEWKKFFSFCHNFFFSALPLLHQTALCIKNDCCRLLNWKNLHRDVCKNNFFLVMINLNGAFSKKELLSSCWKLFWVFRRLDHH